MKLWNGKLTIVGVVPDAECLAADVRALLDSYSFELVVNDKCIMVTPVGNLMPLGAGLESTGIPGPMEFFEHALKGIVFGPASYRVSETDTATMNLIHAPRAIDPESPLEVFSRDPFYCTKRLAITAWLSGFDPDEVRRRSLAQIFLFEPGREYRSVTFSEEIDLDAPSI